jgi:hypothetical protein
VLPGLKILHLFKFRMVESIIQNTQCLRNVFSPVTYTYLTQLVLGNLRKLFPIRKPEKFTSVYFNYSTMFPGYLVEHLFDPRNPHLRRTKITYQTREKLVLNNPQTPELLTGLLQNSIFRKPLKNLLQIMMQAQSLFHLPPTQFSLNFKLISFLLHDQRLSVPESIETISALTVQISPRPMPAKGLATRQGQFKVEIYSIYLQLPHSHSIQNKVF